MNKSKVDVFLLLVKLGIGTSSEASLPEHTDWASIEILAKQQGLMGVLVDGVEKLPVTSRPPQIIWLKWIGEVLQEYNQRYVLYCNAVADLASFYDKHGFSTMLLKGLACGMDWPKPEHRSCGDIDIWQFGKQKEADRYLAESTGIRIDNSHHHHSVFSWEGFTVENHYDFINVHHHRSHIEYERLLKELSKDDSRYIELKGVRVFLPSANLHALFLLKHTMLHFVGTELKLRQVLDWAFFVEKHSKEVDWQMVLEVQEEHGMMSMFNILNSICVENLGFDAAIFPAIQCDNITKNKVLVEIFASSYQDDQGAGFYRRQVNRCRRWHLNGWKHKLCYKESRRSAFWSGVWGHVLKPKSI